MKNVKGRWYAEKVFFLRTNNRIEDTLNLEKIISPVIFSPQCLAAYPV